MVHNVLLVGAGTMGRAHAKAYSKMPDVFVAGIVDINKESAESVGVLVGAPAFNNYEEAKAELKQVDVVDICVPTFLHKEYCLKAAADGKHILCEKPLAGNLHDARTIIEACEKHHVRLFVGHVLRFFPEYERAKRLLDDGAIGEAAVARTSRIGPFPNGWNDWYADISLSGGTVLDLIIHDFDFLRSCFGEVERVYAKGLAGRELARMDYSLVTLRFQNGVIAHVEGSWSHESFTMRFEIAGKKGIIEYDSSKDQPLISRSRNHLQGTTGVAVPESPLHENPYYRELRHYMDCLESGVQPIVTAEDAYRALEISLMAIDSMKTGTPIVKRSDDGRKGDVAR